MKTIPQHITIITSEFPPQPGGIGNHAYNLASQLSKNGYKVIVIADQRSIDGQEELVFDASLSFKVNRIKITKPRIFMYFNRVFTLFKYINTTQHVIATGKFPLWIAAFCSLFFKRNYLAVIHGTEVNFKGFMLRKSINLALGRFTSIVSVSNFTKKLIDDLQLTIHVIPNGYDPEKWKKEFSKSETLKGFPKLITVGNVTSRKGQQNVIRMLPSLIDSFPQLHYHCIGLKTEADTFIQLANELKVHSHVTFHGRIDDIELQGMLLQSDIFVMLSGETKTGDVEGFGIAIIEANALGIPAIGSKNCGIEDAINHGVSGVLINPLDAQKGIEAVTHIMNHRAAYESGAKLWAQQHEWSQIIDRYILLLT